MNPLELHELYHVKPDQIEFYRANGYIKLKKVLSGEILSTYGAACSEVVRSFTRARMRKQAETDYPASTVRLLERTFSRAANGVSTYARAFTQVPNLWRYSDVIEEFVRSRRLAAIASELMGTEGVRLYHDQALYKEPRGGHTPWHVDQYYWPLSNSNTVTAWIPLQAVSMQMGPVAFAKRSHKEAARGIASKMAISDESERLLAELMTNYDVDESPFDLGDLSFHSGWTCHRAGPNDTSQTRAAFTIIYMDRDIRLIEAQHDNHLADARLWLPGVQPGAIAASKLNPVLFER